MVSMMKVYALLCSIAIISCSNCAINDSGSGKSEPVNAPAAMLQTHALSGDSLVLPLSELTKIYVQSIADFIKAANKNHVIKFDTLYFGKHVYGQPDDFPDIELPETIEHTQIRLVTPEAGAQKQKENKSSFFINLMGWADYKKAEFIFVTFSSHNAHQFDYYLNYNYDLKSRTFKLDNIRFERFLYNGE